MKCVIQANPDHTCMTAGTSLSNQAEVIGPYAVKKSLSPDCLFRPYRKPTLVGRENSPKVNERPSVKELGKLTPYLRKKGCLSSFPQGG